MYLSNLIQLIGNLLNGKKMSKIKLAIAVCVVQMVMHSLVYAECGKAFKEQSEAKGWVNDKRFRIENKTFVSIEKVDEMGKGDKSTCNLRRVIKFGNYSSKANSGLMSATYTMQGTCAPKPDVYANAVVDVEFFSGNPVIQGVKNFHIYLGQLTWKRLFTHGFDGDDEYRNEWDDGRICFLPGGRIDFDGIVFSPE